MPKQKIQVMVEPQMLALLQEISKELGEPISPLVNGMLEQLAPGLESMLLMARQARQLDREAKSQFVRHLQNTVTNLEQSVKTALEDVEEAAKKVH